MQKLVTAARTSADWYERFPEHMKLDLMDFAYSYITRSGRIDDARLRAMSPAFMARYEAEKQIGRPDMTPKISDQVPRGQSGRARNRFFDSGKLQRQPHPVRQPCTGARRPAGADRPRRHAQLRAAVRRGLAMGPRLSVARPEARRPHPDVSRRYAGLSGRVLRRGARGLRAAADQHADAAGPAAVLSFGRRRGRRGRRCRIRLAVQRGGLQGHAAANPDRGQWRGRRARRAESLIARAMAAELPHRSAGSRHQPRRHGVLDVFIRLDRPPEGHRASAARHGL